MVTTESIHDVVKSGELVRVRQRLQAGRNDLDALDEMGNTPLHWAVMGGYIDIVKLLLESGADPNRASPRGDTPLWQARDFGLAEIVAVLIEFGATDS